MSDIISLATVGLMLCWAGQGIPPEKFAIADGQCFSIAEHRALAEAITGEDGETPYGRCDVFHLKLPKPKNLVTDPKIYCPRILIQIDP